MTHPFEGISYRDVIHLARPELERIMREGTTPLEENMVDAEFRGYNPPRFARVLGFQKFIKGFFRDAQGWAGYNLFVDNPRGGYDRPWKQKPGSKRHGFYDVQPVRPGRYGDFPNAVLLNYGAGRNSPLNPEGRIRDFVVQIDPGNPDLYLGKAFLDLGVTRAFANFFVIERLR